MFIFLFFIHFIFAQETLPTIQVQGQKLEHQRSVDWPTQDFESSILLSTPQTDEALNRLSGLQTRTQGSPTFSIRGSAQSGRTLVLFNDTPLNFASSFSASPIFLPKEIIGDITVVKGPASLFYGSQAMAGSVNFLPQKITAPQVALTMSDTDESFLPQKGQSLSHNSLHLATPLFQTSKSHLQVSLFNEDDDGRFSYQSKNSSGTRDFNAQNLSRLVVNGSTRMKDLKLEFDGIIGRHILQIPGSTVFISRTRSETQAALSSLTAHYFFAENQSLKSKLSLLTSQSDFSDNSVESKNDQQTWISQNEYSLEWSSQNKFQLFADYYLHQLDNSFVGNSLEQSQFELAPILSFSFWRSIKHQLGGRYLSQTQKLLPTFITHLSAHSFDSWLSYTQGFKSPTFTDLYSSSPTFTANPLLESEESEQYEIGIKKQTTQNLTTWFFDFRLFHMNYSNFIESFEISPGITSRQNQGQGYSRGFDLETRFKYLSIESYIRYNFLETKNQQTQSPFRLSPKHQISLGGLYQLSWGSIEIQHTQWKDFFDISANQNIALEDWRQWNFFIRSQITESLSLSLGVINAFNEKKELTLNYPEPQRRYWLQARYLFGN